MGDPVYIKLGYCVDEDLLERSVHASEGPNWFKVCTRWVMREDLYVDGVRVAEKGELMREDAAPSIKAGLGMASIGGKINGRG